MSETSPQARDEKCLDPKIRNDWEEIEARRIEISSRNGGDTRRQAILKRLGLLNATS